MKTLTLTDKQADKLLEILQNGWDEDFREEYYRSNEMIELSEIINEQLNKQL